MGSRAGVRLRVGNTDAEGRMAMGDVLCRAKELALSDSDPQLFTVATLTGHALLAVGDYSTIMDNGPARAAGTALKMQEAGEKMNQGSQFCFRPGDLPVECLDDDQGNTGEPQEEGTPGPQGDCRCGIKNKPRIVGGKETEINEFPWMASLIE